MSSPRKIDIETFTSIVDAFLSKAKNENIRIVSFRNQHGCFHEHSSASYTIRTADDDFIVELSLLAFEARIMMESAFSAKQRESYKFSRSRIRCDIRIVADNPWGRFSPLFRKLKAVHKELETQYKRDKLSETIDLVNQKINLTDYIVEKEVLKGGK